MTRSLASCAPPHAAIAAQRDEIRSCRMAPRRRLRVPAKPHVRCATELRQRLRADTANTPARDGGPFGPLPGSLLISLLRAHCDAHAHKARARAWNRERLINIEETLAAHLPIVGQCRR